MNFKPLALLVIALFSVPSYSNDYSLGVGIGRPFGIGGINAAYSVTDNLQLALGLGYGKFLLAGKSNFSLGVNYSLGEKGEIWRKRIGLNYNEYQENGIQIRIYDPETGKVKGTASESRFKGIEFDFGITRYFGEKQDQSWEFGTTIPLMKEDTEDDELWGDDTYTSDEDGIRIQLKFYLGYRRYFH